ncbi:hypothetical protein [Bdellovibrio sp. HCB337]|uniref:hypothetical protein n=1 Tax=Bdellovibrio sp. HCB337 TaxID=3394358 RepID=UPI0039A64236
MLRIISLLEEKNHYLEKFYSLNESELVNFSMGHFEGLENFYNTRERILEILKYIDSQLEAANSEIEDMNQCSAEERRQVKSAMAIKDEYVSRIIEQDLEVLACIEAAKSNIIRELQDVRRVRKAVGGYKSPTFNKRLDEEA